MPNIINYLGNEMGNAYYRISKTGLINISYNIGPERMVCSILNVPIDLWNPAKSRLNKKISNFPIDETNAFLNDIENFVNAEAVKLKITSKLNKDNLYKIVKSKIHPEAFLPKLTFFGYYDKFVKDIESGARKTPKGTNYGAGSVKIYKSHMNTLKEFRNVNFNEINVFYYNKLKNWLIDTKKMKPNTIGSIIKDLKNILNLALADGYEVDLSFQKFKVSKEIGLNTIALNEIELQKFRSLELIGHLDNVRNLFLLGCETGLRFSDYSILTKEAIKGHDLHVIQVKTKARVLVPLNSEIQRLLDIGTHPISNQKFNTYLKDIAKKVFKDEKVLISYTKAGKHEQSNIFKYNLITSHVARRTFATLAYKKGIPSLNIMAITGHKTEKSFMTYIKISEQEHADMFRHFLRL